MTLTVLSAQEVPNLIISEIYMGYGNPWRTYAEVTNIGTTTADMSEIWIQCKTNTNYSTSGTKTYLVGTGLDGRTTSQVLEDTITILEPGKSIMILVNKWSAIADPSTLIGPQRLELYETTNTYHLSQTPYFYLQDYEIPSIVFEMDNPWLGTDSNTPMRLWNGDDGLRLVYDRGPGGTPADGIFDITVDSIIDMLGPHGIRMHYSFAGVTNSSDDHVIIRKSSVTTGNPDNETFLASIGDSPELSEWMVIPIRSHPGTAGRFF
ncbi:hypothetical protein KA005_47420, partial [bacterium]|nr:hypothetical protein [bacterium]